MSDEEIVVEEELPPPEEEIEEEAPEVEDDTPPEPEAKPVSRAQQEIIKLRERAQKAEDDIKKAREELESLKKPASVEVDKLWEEEEAALKNPNIQEWQKYAITATRSSRRAEQLATELKMQGVDMRDKMDFDSLKSAKPEVYEKYSSEVEKRYQEFFSKGTIVPRRMICANLLGEDMLSGKLTTKKSPPVKRGETPGARSDAPKSVSPGRNSPEAVARRLENMII